MNIQRLVYPAMRFRSPRLLSRLRNRYCSGFPGFRGGRQARSGTYPTYQPLPDWPVGVISVPLVFPPAFLLSLFLSTLCRLALTYKAPIDSRLRALTTYAAALYGRPFFHFFPFRLPQRCRARRFQPCTPSRGQRFVFAFRRPTATTLSLLSRPDPPQTSLAAVQFS